MTDSDISLTLGGVTHVLSHEVTAPASDLSLSARLLSSKSVKMDADKAEEYVDLPIFEGERRFDPDWAQHLYRQMRQGSFNPHNTIVAIAKLGDIWYKCNGQHTAWAVAMRAQDDPEFSLPIIEQRYEVDSIDQLRRLYSTFDRNKARSNSHISQVHLVDTPEMAGVAPYLIKRLVPGFRLWRFATNYKNRTHSPEEVAALIRSEDFAATFREVAKICRDHSSKAERVFFHRAGVVGAMFATTAKASKASAEFWGRVADGTGLTAKDARLKLRDWLMASSVNASSGSDRRNVSAEDVYRVCILAWNKWREKVPVSRLMVPDRRFKAV